LLIRRQSLREAVAFRLAFALLAFLALLLHLLALIRTDLAVAVATQFGELFLTVGLKLGLGDLAIAIAVDFFAPLLPVLLLAGFSLSRHCWVVVGGGQAQAAGAQQGGNAEDTGYALLKDSRS
jgi:hypothetical protein